MYNACVATSTIDLCICDAIETHTLANSTPLELMLLHPTTGRVGTFGILSKYDLQLIFFTSRKYIIIFI